MSEDRKNFYANAVNILGSIFDVTMVFRSQSPQVDDLGQPMVIKGQPTLSISDEITIRMSPQHAKAFASLLIQQIDGYEKNFQTKLPLPPELDAIWQQYVKGN